MISEDEIIRRRRAVYKSLQPFLNFNQLMEAMWIWESKYSRQDTVSYNKFTLEICDNNELKDARSEIIKSMAKGMSSKIEDMRYDPYNEMLNYKNYAESRETQEYRHPAIPGVVSGKNNEKADKKTIVFGYLIKNICEGVFKHKPTLKDLLIGRLNSKLNGLNPSQIKELEKIISGYGHADLKLTMDAQIQTIHSIYALSCEYIGAPATDKLFSRIFKAAEELPEAINEKPKQWL